MPETQEIITFPVQEQEKPPVLSKIKYGENLSKADVPYTVSVDEEKYVALLRRSGMSEKRIKKQELVIERRRGERHSVGEAWGETNILRPNVITIYADPIYQFYQGYVEIAEKIASGEEKPDKIQFTNFLYTKRLPNYLATAPPERALPFANKLLLQALQRQVDKAVHHETKHILDYSNILGVILAQAQGYLITLGSPVLGGSLVSTLAAEFTNPQDWQLPTRILLGSIVGLMAERLVSKKWSLPELAYSLDPLEKRAREFTSSLGAKPEWRSIITIKPKENPIHPEN